VRDVNSLQEALFQTVGLLVGSMIVARRVVNGELDPSRFVLFIVYLAQVSIITLGIAPTLFDIRAALWPAKYAWVDL
jgi:hypothetical protein